MDLEQVNRDPMAAEMQRMRQQLELMQAELVCARGGGPSSAENQVSTFVKPFHSVSVIVRSLTV